jgi:hypothetical protein
MVAGALDMREDPPGNCEWWSAGLRPGALGTTGQWNQERGGGGSQRGVE